MADEDEGNQVPDFPKVLYVEPGLDKNEWLTDIAWENSEEDAILGVYELVGVKKVKAIRRLEDVDG